MTRRRRAAGRPHRGSGSARRRRTPGRRCVRGWSSPGSVWATSSHWHDIITATSTSPGDRLQRVALGRVVARRGVGRAGRWATGRCRTRCARPTAPARSAAAPATSRGRAAARTPPSRRTGRGAAGPRPARSAIADGAASPWSWRWRSARSSADAVRRPPSDVRGGDHQQRDHRRRAEPGAAGSGCAARAARGWWRSAGPGPASRRRWRGLGAASDRPSAGRRSR